MKILLLGDASNYHSALGQGLARLGHEVTVASHGSRWMNTNRDIDIGRKPGKVGGALLWLKLNTVLASRLKGYDVVQLVNPVFVELRPHRVAAIFKKLKRNNGGIFLTALGTDTPYMEMAFSENCPLRYTEFAVDGKPTPLTLSDAGQNQHLWLKEPLRSHSRYIYENVDGVVSALYEYHLAVERYMPDLKLAYGGIPIDVDSLPFAGRRDADTPIRVLAAYHSGRETEKGMDVMLKIAESVPNIDLQHASGLDFKSFMNRLTQSDIVLDQLYSYTPATTALMAMAMGKTVVTGAEPDFEKFIGEKVPAINVSPLHPEYLADFLSNPGDLEERGNAARDFVRRNNDVTVVAERFLNLWTS